MPSLVALAQRTFWLLFGALFLLAGLGLLAAGALEAWTESRYETEGRLAEGIVLAKHVRRATGQESTEYRVSYRFTSAQGEVIESWAAVGLGRWEELVERGPIEIQYLAGEPARHRVQRGSDWGGVWLTFGLATVAGLAGGAAAVHGWRELHRRRQLLRRGVMAEATILTVEPANIRINGEHLWRVSYEYRDRAGTRHTGASGYLSFEEAQGWQAGDIGGVRYDGEAAARSIWVGSMPSSSAPE